MSPSASRLLVVEQGSSLRVPLPHEGELVIGSAPSADLYVADPSAAAAHARIVIAAGEATLFDLGAPNGTRVNGELVLGEHRLASGDAIAIGAVTLILHRDSSSVEPRFLGAAELLGRLANETERALRYQRPLGVIVVDLGAALPLDDALSAAVLRVLRKVDLAGSIAPGELVVVLPETAETVAVPARRLAAALQTIAPGARTGIARCPLDGSDADALLTGARRAARSAARGAVATVDATAWTRQIGDVRIIAVDPVMTKLLALVERLATSDIPVIVGGETGAGKEVIARALHEWSPRAAARIVSINCAAVPESLLESELFGHEKGAFSGAVSAKPGLLESAAGGTVFLDEVGECSLAAQAKLLRVLETKRIARLGSVVERAIDVRIVAATNRTLEHEVKAGRFRRDLFFRLSAAPVHVPALRERPLDVPALARAFLDEACAHEKREPLTLAPSAMQRLSAHAWPGNVRELRNVMTFVAALAPGPRVESGDLPPGLAVESGTWALGLSSRPAPAPELPRARVFRNLHDEIRELERTRIAEALEEAKGVRVRAAELIGMPLRTLVTKIREYGLSTTGSQRATSGGG